MKILRQIFEFLTSGEFFGGVIERLFALLVSVAVFATVIICYIYKPEILLYLLILGMIGMGWFMLYFIFPEFHERINNLKRLISRLWTKIRSK